MADDSRKTIQRVMAKISSLESENRALRQQLSRFDELQKELHDLQSDYERLKLAKAFGASEEDKQRAYRRLTNMITEIDKCLKMLNK